MSTKTVVVAGYSQTALGIARCLARSGFRVVSIGHKVDARRSPLYYSRIPAAKIVVPNGDDLTQTLIDAGTEFDAPAVLFLTEDSQALQISERRDEIMRAYRILLPPEALTESLLDKRRFAQLALEVGLKVPRSLEATSRDELVAAVRELSFPFVLKPHLRHSRLVRDANELEMFLETLSPENWVSMVAQQWVPGDDRSLYCCFAYFDEKSSPLGSITAQKIRQWIPNSGTTSLCRTVRNDHVREETIRIFSALGLRGYGSIEYKHHAGDRSYYIMEPTIVRFNQQVALFRAAGVNLPVIAAEYLSTGQNRQGSSQRDGVWWIHEFKDFLSSRDPRQEVKMSYWRSLLRADTRVLFGPLDPVPLFAAIGSAVAARLKRTVPSGRAPKRETILPRHTDA